jgi:hypothetical protein
MRRRYITSELCGVWVCKGKCVVWMYGNVERGRWRWLVHVGESKSLMGSLLTLMAIGGEGSEQVGWSEYEKFL